MLAGLLNDFRSQPSGGAWALFHMDQHREIAKVLQTKYNIATQLFPLDQMPIGKMENWLRVHQQVHDSISQHTNVSDANLSEIDLENDSAVNLWLQQHFSEHLAIAQILGIT